MNSFNPCFGGSYVMPRAGTNNIGKVDGFNPCFGGSYVMPRDLCFAKAYYKRFQSLFWWILRYAPFYHVKCKLLVMFQSLFWWILRYAGKGWKMSLKAEEVSILVLVDLTLCQSFKAASGMHAASFNPCFGGSYVMPVISIGYVSLSI